MDISMTVNRQQLIDALKKKRDEVASRYESKIELKSEKSEIVDAYVAGLADYYRKLADMFITGTATFEPTAYGLQVAQSGKEHPTRIKGAGSAQIEPVALFDKEPLPQAPDLTREVVNAKRRSRGVGALKRNLAHAVAPYDAALQLLEMSSDENVGIPAAEYQRLLTGGVGQYDDDDDDLES